MNRQRIVAIQHHESTPVTHSDNEQLDLEVCGCLPLSEYLQYPLLGILLLHRGTLRAFGPGDHIFHQNPHFFPALMSLKRWGLQPYGQGKPPPAREAAGGRLDEPVIRLFHADLRSRNAPPPSMPRDHFLHSVSHRPPSASVRGACNSTS